MVIGLVIYYGGEAYQTIGLTGLGTARFVLGYLLGIILFLTLAVLLQRLVQYLLLDWLVASTIGSSPPRLLAQLSAFFIYLLAFTAIVGVVFKKDLTVVLAASGAAGIVVGMALQNLILDVFAGLATNLDRVVKIGDNIQLHRSGDQIIEGTVEEISWRTMRILDLYSNTVIVPNRLVSSSVITNFSSPQPFSETGIIVTLDSKIPVNRAIRVLQAAATEVSALFTPPGAPAPSVLVSEILHLPKSVKYRISLYPAFTARAYARHLVQQRILHHLSFAGIRPAWQNEPEVAHLARLLGKTQLFVGLAEIDLQFLATHANLKLIEPETIVVQGGEVAMAMFLVVEGLLSAEVRRKIGTKPLPPEVLPPGSLVGGMAMLMGDVYEATVSSQTVSLMVEINYELLEKLFKQQPQAAHLLAQSATQLIHQKSALSPNYWLTEEADLSAEIFRNLKRSFAHLKLD
ncbi:transmembrane transporter [Thioploca ingrica]|uniref:Small-conductance mechanosensitive channel n=1 Tax=Thioploca ingrica TaxID=40754 RepID=A0A090AGZ9_9GAMM|nr:transmembrane transporter [Thioploca ingrica]